MPDVSQPRQLPDVNVDSHVDDEILACLDLEAPESFFLFAGAGSGKTTSLVKALTYIAETHGNKLAEQGRQVAVITYTNAASDVIIGRLRMKDVFHVATIHSFIWSLIGGFQTDIKTWIRVATENEIEKLCGEQTRSRGTRGRGVNKSSEERTRRIQALIKRKEKLAEIRRFTYSPTGVNTGLDSLSHDEVIKMGIDFLGKDTMRKVLLAKYPILLIDECQDTKKEVLDAILEIKRANDQWIVGMFGDVMQRIYMDGKEKLDECIPADWTRPAKRMNYRSDSRIVELVNAIRKDADAIRQQARHDADAGCVHLFVAGRNADKEEIESRVRANMADISHDPKWIEWQHDEEGKTLILEHRMAASRLGFDAFYVPLAESGAFATTLQTGEIAEVELLANIIAPLVEAHKKQDQFTISKIVRKYSRLLHPSTFPAGGDAQKKRLLAVSQKTKRLLDLFNTVDDPKCIDVLRLVSQVDLFPTNERAALIVADPISGEDKKVMAMRQAMQAPFTELISYYRYVTGQTPFDTHQGIKGLEFDRVMVIMDDADARGRWFSYEKLFGVKAETETDLRNRREGKDTSLDRVRRLFYVTCTRARHSLAVLAYSESPQTVKDTALSQGWFSEDEISILR